MECNYVNTYLYLTGKKDSSLRFDVNLIGAQLIYYFTKTSKNFKFNGFSDKKFVDNLKNLMKNISEFAKYLDMTGLSAREFVKIAIYVSPSAFTSNIVKFIKKNYFHMKK